MNDILRDKLTVIIPTHNREKYLGRSVEYWSSLAVYIIVVDSSSEETKLEFPANFEYHHLPNESFSKKISYSLSKVKTSYVVMCPDDDFQTENGLTSCVNFLEENQNYSAVHGRYISFLKNKEIFIKDIYGSIDKYEVSDINVLDRLKLGLENYILWYWAIHRTEEMKIIFSEYRNVVNGNLIEIGIAIGHLSAGGHKQLPVFYQAREEIALSWGRTEPEFSFLACEDSDLEEWRRATIQIIIKLSGMNESEARAALLLAENSYTRFLSKRKTPVSKVRASIKKYLPFVIYEHIVRTYKAIFKLNPSNGVHQMKYKWWDQSAKKSWQTIFHFIN